MAKPRVTSEDLLELGAQLERLEASNSALRRRLSSLGIAGTAIDDSSEPPLTVSRLARRSRAPQTERWRLVARQQALAFRQLSDQSRQLNLIQQRLFQMELRSTSPPTPNKPLPVLVPTKPRPQLPPWRRKLRKLFRSPAAFFRDMGTRRTP